MNYSYLTWNFIKTKKLNSKVIILDANQKVVSKGNLFNLVMKVEPPSLEEVGMMIMGATLISALQLSVQNENLLEKKYLKPM